MTRTNYQRRILTCGSLGVVVLALAACSRKHSSSSDDKGSPPIDVAPQLKTLFTGMQIDSDPPAVGFIAPDGGDGVATTTPVVVVFSESMDASTITQATFGLTNLGGGGGGGTPGGGGGFPGGVPGLGQSQSGNGGAGNRPPTAKIFGDIRNDDGTGGDGTGGDGTGGDGTGGDGTGGDGTGETPDLGTPVAGSVVADPDTNQRTFLFIPTQALAEATDYSFRLSNTIADTEGLPIPTESSDDDSVGGALTGVAVERTFTTVSDADTAEFQVVAMYPRPDETNVPVDTIVKIYFNMAVDSKVLPNQKLAPTQQSLQLWVNNKFVADAPFKVDRLAVPGVGALAVRLKPRVPFPPNAIVKIVVNNNARAANNEVLDDGGEKFEATFRTSTVATPIAIALNDTLPLTVGGVGYDGALSANNVAKFRADVSLDGTGDADTVTLIYFQGGVTGGVPIARTVTSNAGSIVTKTSADLSGGKGGTVFRQSDSQSPVLPVLVGAFATKGGLNSPVGPLTLLDLFVETTRPKIEFGPPTPYGKLSLATTLSRPAFYGSASEPLKTLRVVLGAKSTPVSYDAIKLGDEGTVTGGDDFFVTDGGTSVLPGAGSLSGPQYLPVPIDEIVAEDRFGNRTEKSAPDAGELRQEGSVGGALESDAVLEMRVRVVASDTLAPLEQAVVQVAQHPFVALGPAPLTKKTNADGEVRFAAGELAAYGPTLSITASDKGHDVLTVAGVASPLGGSAFGISLPLEPTGAANVTVTAAVTGSIPVADAPQSFVAAAANVATPSGLVQAFDDERFSTLPLSAPSVALNVKKNRPVIVTTLEHDGDGAYVSKPGDLEVFSAPTTVPFSYAGAGGPTLPIATTFANSVISIPEIESTGITPGLGASVYLTITHGRLVARLPGLEGVFPLTFSPLGFQPPGPGQPPSDPTLRVLFAPIPQTLWLNEPSGDPLYERLVQPEASTLGANPSDELLESVFRFEIEVAEEMQNGSTQRTRQTAHLDFQHLATASTDEPIDLPTIPDFVVQDAVHPITIGNLTFDVVVADSVLRVVVRSGTNSRRWTVLCDAASVVANGNVLPLPLVTMKPFADPGTFQLAVEVIELEPGGFSIDSFVFSDLEREQRRAARSGEATVDTTPP